MFKSRFLTFGMMAAALMWAANAPAQNTNNNKKSASENSTEVKKDTKTTTDRGTTKTNADIVYGKVESYDAGKSIKVSIPGKVESSKTFDLSGNDITANVPATIKVGDWIRVRERADNKGFCSRICE